MSPIFLENVGNSHNSRGFNSFPYHRIDRKEGSAEWNGRMEGTGEWLKRNRNFTCSEDVTHTEHEAQMYEVDCGFYKIVVSEEQLKRYGMNYATLQKADTKAMQLERAERQRNADNIRRLDPTPPKSSKRERSPPPSSPPSPPCSLESIIEAPEGMRPLHQTRVCMSLTGWFRSFGDYWF